jgi:hypothetical protein
VFYMNVANVVRMLQDFIQIVSSVSDICCKCFVWLLHMFHTYVASVYSECFNYFRRMLHQVFHVAIVSCFKRILLDGTAEVTWRASAGRARRFLHVCARNRVGVDGPRTRVGGPRVRAGGAGRASRPGGAGGPRVRI